MVLEDMEGRLWGRYATRSRGRDKEEMKNQIPRLFFGSSVTRQHWEEAVSSINGLVL